MQEVGLVSWFAAPGEELVYGVIGPIGHGVVLPRRYAVQLGVLLTEGTWGGLRRQLGADVVEGLAERRAGADEDSPPPADDEPYSPEAMYGWDDGDYPDWAQQRMLDWMPEDLIDEYAAIDATALNGEYVEIDGTRMDDLARDLEARGFRCIRDDALVTFVSRYGPAPDGRA
jgi:hypothetical protein